jgi:hypothetical protein
MHLIHLTCQIPQSGLTTLHTLEHLPQTLVGLSQLTQILFYNEVLTFMGVLQI